MLVHVNACTCHAALPGGTEVAGDDAVHRSINIGVVEHDDGRLAAEFERHDSKVLCGVAHHVARRIESTSECDARHQRVAGEDAPARVALTRDHVHHTRRKAHLVCDTRQLQQCRRAMLAGLQHDGVPGCERRPHLHRRQKELVVPGHNTRDHADGLAHREHEHVVLVDGKRGAFEFVGRTREVVVVLGDVADHAARLAVQLAGVEGLDRADLVGLLRQSVAEPAKHRAALCCGHASPRSFGHCPVCGVHRAVDIVGRGGREGGPHLARGRIDAFENATIRCVDPRAIDVHPQCGQGHGVLSLSRSRSMSDRNDWIRPATVWGHSSGVRWRAPSIT